MLEILGKYLRPKEAFLKVPGTQSMKNIHQFFILVERHLRYYDGEHIRCVARQR